MRRQILATATLLFLIAGAGWASDEGAPESLPPLESLPQGAAYEAIKESRGLVFLDVYADW